MSTSFLTLYVLIWPVVVAVILTTIARAVFEDMRKARRPMI